MQAATDGGAAMVPVTGRRAGCKPATCPGRRAGRPLSCTRRASRRGRTRQIALGLAGPAGYRPKARTDHRVSAETCRQVSVGAPVILVVPLAPGHPSGGAHAWLLCPIVQGRTADPFANVPGDTDLLGWPTYYCVYLPP